MYDDNPRAGQFNWISETPNQESIKCLQTLKSKDVYQINSTLFGCFFSHLVTPLLFLLNKGSTHFILIIKRITHF